MNTSSTSSPAMHFHSHRSHTVLKYIGHEQSIVYGSTKGFVSYGGFTHVGFPYARRFPLPHFIRLVSNYHSPLSLPLPSRRSRVPASAVVLLCCRAAVLHCLQVQRLVPGLALPQLPPGAPSACCGRCPVALCFPRSWTCSAPSQRCALHPRAPRARVWVMTPWCWRRA